MSCVTYNCDELTDHTLNECDEFLLGGSDQIVILECGHDVTDPSNGTLVQAAITNGTAKLVQNVKFGIAEPAPIEVDSPISGQVPKIANYDRSAGMIDANVNASNLNDFYNSLLGGRQISGLIVYMVGEAIPTVRFINPPKGMYAKGGYTSPDTDSDFQKFVVNWAWKDLNNPSYHAAPAGIFD